MVAPKIEAAKSGSRDHSLYHGAVLSSEVISTS